MWFHIAVIVLLIFILCAILNGREEAKGHANRFKRNYDIGD